MKKFVTVLIMLAILGVIVGIIAVIVLYPFQFFSTVYWFLGVVGVICFLTVIYKAILKRVETWGMWK